MITITNFDIFGLDYRMYTFRNQCVEARDLPYEDGLCHIYFNTTGKKGGSKSVENMLNYIQRSKAEAVSDPATKQLDERVRKVRMDPELRRSAMTWGNLIDSERREASQETIIDAILSILSVYGTVPEVIKEQLGKVKDPEALRLLIPEAVRAGSAEAFMKVLDEKKIS